MARIDPPLPGKEHIRALSRQDFGFFARGGMQALHPATRIKWAPYLDVMAAKLTEVIEGRCRRLIICIPPRYGKSQMVSINLPAFVLGHRPSAEVVCASYSNGLAARMGRDSLRLMASPFYTQLFGNRLASAREPKGDIKTPQGGCRFATSVGGTLTGRGGNFIIVDDPIRPDDSRSDVKRQAVNDWFDSTVISRPNDKQSDSIVVIMQRLHEDDLVGHLEAKGGWETLSLPAIAEVDEAHHYRTSLGMRTWHRKEGEALHPDREPLGIIAGTRASMSAYDFAAQYQQRPAPAGGGDIKQEWFRRYPAAEPAKFVQTIQAWDTASKDNERADYSACVTIGETSQGHYYVLHVYRERLLYPELKRKVRELAELHGASTVLIENSASGMALNQELRGEGFARIQPVEAKGSKYERVISVTGMIDAGKVWIPDQAHWVEDFLHEAAMFPSGRHDDQVDALAHGLAYFAKGAGGHRFLRMLDEADALLRAQRCPEEDPTKLTVRFDHSDHTCEFKASSGRWIKRSEDGLYHVTPSEWAGLQFERGVRLVFHPEIHSGR